MKQRSAAVRDHGKCSNKQATSTADDDLSDLTLGEMCTDEVSEFVIAEFLTSLPLVHPLNVVEYWMKF